MLNTVTFYSQNTLKVFIFFLDITVPSSQTGRKKNYCPYCLKPQAKLPRHLVTVHKAEDEIIRYENCADTKMRLLVLAKLRKLGNFKHTLCLQGKQPVNTKGVVCS